MTVIIDKDHVAEPGQESRVGTTFGEAPQYGIERVLGIESAMPSLGELVRFRMYDDDGELYYEGRLTDDDECINQSGALRFGEMDAGCTTIKVLRNGAWVQEIG